MRRGEGRRGGGRVEGGPVAGNKPKHAAGERAAGGLGQAGLRRWPRGDGEPDAASPSKAGEGGGSPAQEGQGEAGV